MLSSQEEQNDSSSEEERETGCPQGKRKKAHPSPSFLPPLLASFPRAASPFSFIPHPRGGAVKEVSGEGGLEQHRGSSMSLLLSSPSFPPFPRSRNDESGCQPRRQRRSPSAASGSKTAAEAARARRAPAASQRWAASLRRQGGTMARQRRRVRLHRRPPVTGVPAAAATATALRKTGTAGLASDDSDDDYQQALARCYSRPMGQSSASFWPLPAGASSPSSSSRPHSCKARTRNDSNARRRQSIALDSHSRAATPHSPSLLSAPPPN